MEKTWVLVADRVRARLFEMDGKGTSPVEIRSFVNPSGREAKGSRGDKRPVRTMESVGGARHAIEPKTTPEEKHAAKFARDLNNVIDLGRSQNAFTQLILIAPPRFLGTLRKSLSSQIAPLVIKAIEHDLTESTEGEISHYLEQ